MKRAVLAFAVLALAVASPQAQRPAASPPVVSFDVVGLSIADLQQAMSSGRATSRQIVDAYLARINAYDLAGPSLNAIASVNPHARAQADRPDAERAAGTVRGPLHGIPILVKDNYETIDLPTTAGSLAFLDFHPKRDAFLVQRLKAAGAIVLAKTNMHEMAAGITTTGSGFGQTRNPYELERNPGGSSGGTGAAVAAEFGAAGLGTDTCGSIRLPAAHNNLVGLRGTQGTSSRSGIVPLSLTQDIGGPLARSMSDLAWLLDVTVAADPADGATMAHGRTFESFSAAVGRGRIAGLRLGVIRQLFGTAPEDAEVAAVVTKGLDALKSAGAVVEDVVVPGLDEWLRGSSMINADFKLDLAAYLANAPGAPVASLGEMLDEGLLHASLDEGMRTRNAVTTRDTEPARRAKVKRAALAAALEAVFEEQRYTALVYPTVRRKAARIGEAQQGSNCQLSAHSGLPALALPIGFTADGLPVGIDLLGPAFSDVALVEAGAAIEARLALRQLPFSTPRLIDGRVPSALRGRAMFMATAAEAVPVGVTVDLEFSPITSELQYVVRAPADDLTTTAAIWIHERQGQAPGPAKYKVFGPGAPTAGRLRLALSDRRALADGRLHLRLYRHGLPRLEAPIALAPVAPASAKPR